MKRILSVLLILALLLTPAFAAGEYSISAGEEPGGSVLSDVSSAKAGDTVTGRAEALPGWDVATVRVNMGARRSMPTWKGIPSPSSCPTVT